MIFQLINDTERKANIELTIQDNIEINTLEELIELINKIDIPEHKPKLFSGNTLIKKCITIKKNPPQETIEAYRASDEKNGWFLKTIINKFEYTITVTDYNQYWGEIQKMNRIEAFRAIDKARREYHSFLSVRTLKDVNSSIDLLKTMLRLENNLVNAINYLNNSV